MSREHDLHQQVATALGGAFVVDDVTITPAGRRRVVRITVERPLESPVGDTPLAPLSLDEVAEATRLVSAHLDESDVLGSQPYTLEVSSPGTSRPLTTPEHFRRNVGRLVAVERPEGGTVTGRVLATTDEGVRIEVPAERKTPAQEVDIPFAQLTQGKVQVEFNRPGDPSDDHDERN